MTCVDLKLLFYVANAALVVFAILLLVLGIHSSKLPGPALNGSSACIVIGTFILFVTVIGFLALELRQFPLGIIYMIMLMCVFGAQVVFSTRVLFMDETLMIKSFLRNAYVVRTKNETDKQILEFQKYFKCCGYNGFNGNEAQLPQNATILIPECCPQQETVCTKLDSYRDTCVQQMTIAYNGWTKMIGLFLAMSCFVLLLVGILGIKMISAM